MQCGTSAFDQYAGTAAKAACLANGGGGLPNTGINLAIVVVVSIGLLALGLLAVFGGRR